MGTKKGIQYILISLIIILAVITGKQYEERQRFQESIAEKIIRFHVIANSDSEEDQALKLKVRDAVGVHMGEILKAVDSREGCEAAIAEHMEEIRAAAEKVILEEGYNYAVAVSLADVEFPVKTYGSYTFPAGTYEALELTIGAGTGHNWWCVMYPNMCFSGSVYEVVDENAQESLKEVLTPEEYEAVFSEGDYEVRFKYLSFLNQFADE